MSLHPFGLLRVGFHFLVGYVRCKQFHCSIFTLSISKLNGGVSEKFSHKMLLRMDNTFCLFFGGGEGAAAAAIIESLMLSFVHLIALFQL